MGGRGVHQCATQARCPGARCVADGSAAMAQARGAPTNPSPSRIHRARPCTGASRLCRAPRARGRAPTYHYFCCLPRRRTRPTPRARGRARARPP
eukprot:scaffold58528_cov26-Tisochrysis_lutea.AAC.2